MATERKFRRGTSAEHNSFTGASGELTVVTDDHSLRIHDGLTAGGHTVGTGTELEVVARSLNVLNSDVMYATDTVSLLDDKIYIYNASTQVTYSIPELSTTGETITSISGNQLTASTAEVYTLSKAQPALYQYDKLDFEEVYGESTDREAALNIALATARIVYLSDAITVTSLELNPRNKLVSCSQDVVVTADSIELNSYSELENLTIDATDSTADAVIFSNGGTKPKVRYCKLQNVGDSVNNITFTNVTKGHIHECETTDGSKGFTLWGSCTKCKITGGSVDSSKGMSVLVHNNGLESSGHRIRGVDITNAGRADSTTNPDAHCIQVWGGDSADETHVRGTSDIRITDINIDTATGAGIWTAQVDNCEISECSIKNVRKEGLDFEGSINCRSHDNYLYNAGRTFGAMVILFRSERCSHYNNEVLFDGDFNLLGGGEHDLASSLSGYVRDECYNCSIRYNTINAINTGGKISSITVYKSDVDVYSNTGAVKPDISGNKGVNYALRVLADTSYPTLKYNEQSFDESTYTDGTLSKVLYVVNSYAPKIIGNTVEIDGEVRDTTTSSNNAPIFCLFDTNPQRGVRGQINDNIVRNFDTSITYQNYYSGYSSAGSVQFKGNTATKIAYSSTISTVGFSENYSDSDFSEVTATTI